jgi:hypothetical protein
MASACAGAVAGGLGAGAALFAYAAATHGVRVTPELAGGICALGAVIGGAFGRLSRRLFRPGLRVFWATSVTASLWLFVYAFLMMRFFPVAARALSFLHTLPGIAIYGLFVGAMPPLRRRKEHGRSV